MTEAYQRGMAAWQEGNYAKAAFIYEAGIEVEPEQLLYYWYLGLAQLLQGQEEAAQITWMSPMVGASELEIDKWMGELVAILEKEAVNQAEKGAYRNAWLIRQHLREIDSDNNHNLQQLLWVSIKGKVFKEENEVIAQLIQIYQEGETIEEPFLLQILEEALQLNPFPPSILQWLKVCAASIADWEPMIKLLISKLESLYYQYQYQIGADIARFCLDFAPDNLNIVLQLANFTRKLGVEGKWESVKLGERYLAESQDLCSKLTATHCILAALMEIEGQFERGLEIYQLYKTLILEIVEGEKAQKETDLGLLHRALIIGAFCFYFEDVPQINRPLRNGLAQLSQDALQSLIKEEVNQYEKRHRERKSRGGSETLKIGYLSECFRQHSVGWLVRWLLKYHHRDNFEVHLYSVGAPTRDALQQQFRAEYGDNFHHISPPILQIAHQIYQDEIDILVDLDSLTSFPTLAAMAAKPAPVQVTFLGQDASGLPAIDYFIADPYVLPDNAQPYYQEKIWRLPHTYIAVDGFEVGVPTLRRPQLDLPENAIIYFSSQSGYKRHPDNVRLQLRILKQVPNSYFLVKGRNKEKEKESLASFFHQIAEEEGVCTSRLRFLPKVDHEVFHRAHLTLADVALDTYPYNGATTTLETLWMGIPLVTRVGEQFAARNSYSMMMNVGVTEGIAFSDEEYVQWGVRLGTDTQLRQQVAYKLRQSRHTSPLWNGEQFAREMEKAYEEMWRRYVTAPSNSR